MTTTTTLYRVLVQTTSSDQPSGTFWQTDKLNREFIMLHPPGPWKVTEPPDALAVTTEDGQDIATINDDNWPGEQCEAIARLVAQAPAMFDVLARLAAQSLRPQGPLDVTVREAFSILAKVERGKE